MPNTKTSPLISPASSSSYGYIAVGIAFFILLVTYAVHYSFGVFFKPVIEELGWSRAALSGAFSISWVLQGVLAIFMGWLNDKLGPRIVLSISGFLVGGGYLLLSRMTTIWELYLYYGVIIGIGLSGMVVPLLSTVARQFTLRRSLMTSTAAIGVGVGILIGPPAVNLLVSLYDWRQSYLFLGALIFVVIIFISQWLRRPEDSSITAPITNEENQPDQKDAPYNYSLKEAGKTGQFWLVFIIFFCVSFCQYVVLVHVIPHATDMGISPTSAANVLSIYGGASVAGGILLSGAADKIGVRAVYIIGFILVAGCLFWLIVITNVIPLYIFAAIFGFGIGGICAAQSLVVASLFGTRAHGIIFGILNNGFTIGAAITPILAGYIFDVSGAYYPAFIASGAVGCAGILLSLWLKRPSRKLSVLAP
jgi:MFS family permease